MYTVTTPHIHNQIQPQATAVYLLNCRITTQGGSLEESGGWAKWRQAAGRKPFTQTLNKVPLDSFQLPAEEE